jgi:ectoine hydroxylase-related dioxygenase (phytanoyl-CoA dioxygenase family)
MIDLAPHHRELEEQGYTIVEGLIDDDLVDALLADVHRLEAELGRSPDNNRFEGNRTTRTYNLLAHGAHLAAGPHPAPGARAGRRGPRAGVPGVVAGVDLARARRDRPAHPRRRPGAALAKPHVATVCNSMWALTDFTEANGATRIVPGSHRWQNPDYGADPTGIDTVAAEMPRGSVLVWHGSTWHGGGANTTDDEIRVGVAMNYCAGWIRQQENQHLGIPPEIVATFTPQLRQLCGFGMYRGLTGNIEKHSPATLLYGDPPQTQLWDHEPIEAPPG